MILTTVIDGKREVRTIGEGAHIIGRGQYSSIRFKFPDVSERHARLLIHHNKVELSDLGSSNGTYVNGMEVTDAIDLPFEAIVQIGECKFWVSPDSEEPADAAVTSSIASSEVETSIPPPPPPVAEMPSVEAEAPVMATIPPPQPPTPPPSSPLTEISRPQPRSAAPVAPVAPVAPAAPTPAPTNWSVNVEPPPAPVAPAAPVYAPAEATVAGAGTAREVRAQIQRELLRRMDIKRMAVNGADRELLAAKAQETIAEIIAEVVRNGRMPAGIDPVRLEREVFDESVRLGPLEDLLADASVSEIMVNGATQIYVERAGRLQLTDRTFVDDEAVMGVIERIVAPIGRRCDESQPYVDARLADGSRVNAIIPPLSLSGPVLTIRKFTGKTMTVEDMIAGGTWTKNIVEFLRLCVRMRKNIVVSGGTGSGKTTLLNLLSTFIPENERIVTVEDAAELSLRQPHVIRLEARPANIEGRGAVTIRDLVRNCLRMRPDRIIVGECRGGEALDMLQAMNTGHDGSLTTIHANSPRDVVSRLETMVLMSGMDLPSRAIREQIASAVDLIVHESRFSDGTRRVVSVTEVTGIEGQQIVMQELFTFRQDGIDANGRIIGEITATGAVPTWLDALRKNGIAVDMGIFQPR